MILEQNFEDNFNQIISKNFAKLELLTWENFVKQKKIMLEGIQLCFLVLTAKRWLSYWKTARNSFLKAVKFEFYTAENDYFRAAHFLGCKPDMMNSF